jgi:aminopeptidase N
MARPFAFAGTKRVYERARPFNVNHIAIDLTLRVADKGFDAVTEVFFTRVDPKATSITLDAVAFDIESVEIAINRGPYESATYVYEGKELKVDVDLAGTAAKVRVRYRATPRGGMYFLAPDEHVPTRPTQVWTQCQDEDARFIFPCIDKPHVKQTTELTAHVPAGWFVLSNGELVNDAEAQAKGVFHWKMNEPHPSYLFTLVAGDFARVDDDADGLPIYYLARRDREADIRRTFARTPAMIRRFGELTGVKYPWNKYAQVVVDDFIFGGMENTTATTMYEHILLDERAALDISSDDLVAHELAHQWFGDLVTCRDWSHGWLNEGFATFMEHIDREGHLGRDEYDYSVRGDMETYVSEARGRYKRPIVCQDYEAPIDIFDRHLYEKGSCVLHMLRLELGDELFWKGVSLYLNRHMKGVVETRDLQRALEEISGRSLERFFEQWVFRAGHPELDIKIEHADGALTVTVKQTQQGATAPQNPSGAQDVSTPVFAFDLTLDIDTGDRHYREVRAVDQASHVFTFACPKRPRFVIVDADQRVLSELTLTVPGDLLRAQLAHAPTTRGRMLAIDALSKLDDAPTTRALEATLGNDKEFWGTRAEAAHALGVVRSEAAYRVLARHVETKHPKARRAVVAALGKFRTAAAAELLKKRALSDESYLVQGEAARALGATRQPIAFDTLIDVIDRPAWADVIRVGAIDGLANLRDERAVPHVLARTRYGVSNRGRRAAIGALPKLASDRKTREVLEELLDQTDPYLRVEVARALGELGDVKARGALQRALDRDIDGRVRRRLREVLRDLGLHHKRESDKLRDELETMRTEHAELRARVAKIEALAPKSAEASERATPPASKAKKPAPMVVKKKEKKRARSSR